MIGGIDSDAYFITGHEQTQLTLKASNENCSKQHFDFLLLSFGEIRLDVSCESSASERIHMKYQV